MQAYHVTSATSATALLAEGAQASRINSNGGIQAGRGFYLAPDQDAAAYWMHKIGQAADVIVTVTLPDSARFLPEAETATGADKIAWAVEAGWLENRYFSPRFWQEALGLSTTPDFDSMGAADAALLEQAACWTLLGLWTQAHGYDGYYAQSDTLVVLNFDLLGAEAFSH